MKLINRVAVLVIALVVISLAWFDFRYSRPQAPKPKYVGPVSAIRVGTIGDYSALDLIAKEKGFFTENGLDVTFNEYHSGPEALDSLLAGDDDFVLSTDFAIVNYIFKNRNLRITNESGTRNSLKLVARKDKGINSARDLKGKKVAITKFGSGAYIFGRFMELNGLSAKDITIIDMQPPEIVASIESGQIDAALTFEPNIYNIQKNLGENVAVLYSQEDIPTSLLKVSTEDYITKNPDIVRRYVTSLFDAENYINNNNSDARDLLIKILPEEADYISSSWQEFNFKLSLNQAILQKMEDEAVFYQKNILNASTSVPDYTDYIYFDALNKVKPEAVTIFH